MINNNLHCHLVIHSKSKKIMRNKNLMNYLNFLKLYLQHRNLLNINFHNKSFNVITEEILLNFQLLGSI